MMRDIRTLTIGHDMLTLALIGLIGGLVTGVSPCVLPMLPIIFFAGGAAAGADEPAGSLLQRVRRPALIISGLVTSFSLFTLLGSALLSALGLPDSFLRWAGLTVLSIVGVGMLVPALGHMIEKPFYRLPKVTGQRGGPFVLGLGLGTLYVPCAGPILAAITVAGATGHIGLRTVVLTITFAMGAALPLLIFAAAGANIRQRINAYRTRARAFQVGSGIVMIALALALAFNLTDVIQRLVPDYTAGLQRDLANSNAVQGSLTPFATAENKGLALCTPGAAALNTCGKAPALRDTQRWFNTPGGTPVTLDKLRGKVVVLDFFAYSCINCQRDQPYLEKWYQAYAADGLVVLGVHAPEFAFEKSADNLQASLSSEGTTYPVVQDNNLATWTAYRNRYWPAKYVIDPTGTVRAIRFGEGGYDAVEQQIRSLLTQAHPGISLPSPVTQGAVSVGTTGQTPETYLAPHKSGYHGSPTYLSSAVSDYQLDAAQPQDTFSLGGGWNVLTDSIRSVANATVRLHFRATHVYTVLAGKGWVTVSEPGRPDRRFMVSGTPNLYHVIDSAGPLDETITLTYSSGVEAFTFSFG
jgi:cytochrome c biogenesis protein CcdA/thiol-disulfide isomerase/thioredoxin